MLLNELTNLFSIYILVFKFLTSMQIIGNKFGVNG